jgi:hypothetical protein
MLNRVHVSGLDRRGRVVLGEEGTEVKFIFMSLDMARQVKSRPHALTTRGYCYVSVSFTDKSTPTSSGMYDECAEPILVPVPPCTIGKIIQRAIEHKDIELVPGSKLTVDYKQNVGKFSSSLNWRIRVNSIRGQSVRGCP